MKIKVAFPQISTAAQPLVLVSLSVFSLLLSGSVSAETKPDKSPTSMLDEAAFDSSFSKLPTNITSDTLTLNAKTRIFVYQGNVTVLQGDMKLTSKTLEGSYSDKNQIQKLVAKGDVEITKQDIHATSQLAFYDAAEATITLTDNPQLQQGESMLTADRIKVFLNENRSQAEGAVRVTLVQQKGGSTLPLSQMTGSKQATAEPKPQDGAKTQQKAVTAPIAQ
jgi:lipopolysaccharide export system protein LptA